MPVKIHANPPSLHEAVVNTSVMYISRMDYEYPAALPPHASSVQLVDPQLRTTICYTNVGMDANEPGLIIPGLSGSIAGDDADSGSFPMHKSLSVYREDGRLACSRTGGKGSPVNPLLW